MERTSQPGSCSLTPKHSPQRFSDAHNPSSLYLRATSMNRHHASAKRLTQPRLCGQESMRMISANLRFPSPAEQCAGGNKRPRPQNSGQGLRYPARARARPAARPVALKSCNKNGLRTGAPKIRAQTSTWRRRNSPQRLLPLRAARS